MRVIDESVADRRDLQGAYFDGSLDLLRELAVHDRPSRIETGALPGQSPSKRLEAREQEPQEVHEKIDAELHTVGLQHFGEAIAQRMELIEMLAARFNNDSRMIRRICLEVLDRIASILEPELQIQAGCGQQA